MRTEENLTAAETVALAVVKRKEKGMWAVELVSHLHTGLPRARGLGFAFDVGAPPLLHSPSPRA